MKYKITLKTDYWHACRHSSFNGKTSVSIIEGLTLKRAQELLLILFNTDYGKNYKNWGLARIHHPFYTSSFKDGTRSYTWDYYTATIEIDTES